MLPNSSTTPLHSSAKCTVCQFSVDKIFTQTTSLQNDRYIDSQVKIYVEEIPSHSVNTVFKSLDKQLKKKVTATLSHCNFEIKCDSSEFVVAMVTGPVSSYSSLYYRVQRKLKARYIYFFICEFSCEHIYVIKFVSAFWDITQQKYGIKAIFICNFFSL